MKKRMIFSITTAFCLMLTIFYAGCSLLFGDNAEPVKALMCPMSQELSDLDEQIIDSFSFMEGKIQFLQNFERHFRRRLFH